MAAPTTHLYLIRHGTTDGNVGGLFLGRTDMPLNAVGDAEADRLAARLAATPIDAIVSSPLKRAHATAERIASRHSTTRDVSLDDRLREMDLGDFDGQPAKDVHGAFPELIHRWRTDPTHVRMPGETAESLSEVQARSIAALTDLSERFPGGRVAVVTHTFVVLSVVCHVLGVPLAQFRRLFIDRASVTAIDWSASGAVLRRFNDTAHLD